MVCQVVLNMTENRSD